jgi:dolichol-phosphate mannosyltransferase
MNVSIVVPTLNEFDNIGILLEQIIESAVNISETDIEILVVDDGSNDGTKELVQKMQKRSKNINLIIRKENKSLAKSVYEGIRKSKYNEVIVLDSDMTHDPSFIPELVNSIKNHDMVIGSRFVNGGGMENKIHEILSKNYNKFVRKILHIPFKDTTGGYFIAKKDLLLKFNEENVYYGFGDYFFRLTYFSMKESASIIEIPVNYKERKYGQKKSNYKRLIFVYTYEVLRLFFRQVIEVKYLSRIWRNKDAL